MKSVNLIPTPRRDAKRRRRHRNVCVAVCGGYALVLVCAVGVTQMIWHTSGAELRERLASTDNDIRRLERQAADARSELTVSRATIEANRTVAEQPDWSVLLALLAKTTGSDVVLRTITISPPPAAPGATPVAKTAQAASGATSEFALELTGIGRTPLAVSQHVLRLEQTGLFSKVALVDTGRESFLNDNSIAFRLQCTFGEGRPQPLSPIVNVPALPTAPAQPSLSNADQGGITR